ncbi:MAG: hypothetical protein H3Z52_04300 [archaeon]|nr:hypothetical protein [archaeon]MCP8320151.1 hypothetical protein [archaeon]
MIYIGIGRHSPESCPMFNEKNRKMILDAANKLEGLAKKHGVKVIGVWNVPSEHLTYFVYDAPSQEALLKFGMEPEMSAWDSFNTTEYKMAFGLEEAIKMLKQAK